jgi:hypothetical protein
MSNERPEVEAELRVYWFDLEGKGPAADEISKFGVRMKKIESGSLEEAVELYKSLSEDVKVKMIINRKKHYIEDAEDVQDGYDDKFEEVKKQAIFDG